MPEPRNPQSRITPRQAILPPIDDPSVHQQIDRLARRYLAASGLGMEILATIGGSAQGLIERLPRFVRSRLDGLTLAALNRAFAAATRTRRYVRDRGDWFNRLASTVSGAAGGVAGLPGAMIELPVTVTMLLRAILDIAEEHGLDPESDEVRIEALRVFAAAGPMSEDDGTDLGLLAAKLSITGQTVQGIIARIAPRLAAVLGQKLAAQATPVFGALAGASINYTFARYYQEIARVHFGVLRLSQETGLPREALTEALRLRIEQLQDDRIERRVRKV
ncbi:EcsC family protein [Paracoccus sphaerophysae]|uniref:EcsC family protein n=1 Tax=Paracoccus sphaerophysae TaxID=690417 RepID=UPI00235369AA|nr:EcsC family protein [Paracoccus sphaerophysae]